MTVPLNFGDLLDPRARQAGQVKQATRERTSICPHRVFLAGFAHHASWSMSDGLLGTNIGNEFLVDHIRPFPLRDMSCSGYADES